MFSIIRAYETKHGLDEGLARVGEDWRNRRRDVIMAAYHFVNTVLAIPSGAAQVGTWRAIFCWGCRRCQSTCTC
mgnify:CR=1 FL=1